MAIIADPQLASAPGPGDVAAAAGRLVLASRPELLATLRGELELALSRPVGPILAALTPDCPRAPLKVAGPREATGAELTALAARIGDAAAWTGRARLGGEDCHLLAVAIPAPDGRLASVFAFQVGDDQPLPPGLAQVARGLCAVVAAAYARRSGESSPAQLTTGMAIARERARTIAELGEAHESALTAILAALRSNQLDDASARRTATDAAVEALLQLRALGDRDRALSEVAASAAFGRLATELRALARHAGIALELASPDSPRLLPGELANGARAITRGIALALLDQQERSRLRVGWCVSADALTLSVRDDGAGRLTGEVLSSHRVAERVAALGGELRVDATPGWGTVVDVELPLAPLRGESVSDDPLAVLNTREREVLDELAAGRRNREIAETLSITVHTVKFHVANILRKLDVNTRGQAAALAREPSAADA
jgi:DNA-binding CsgD family transcriptional regulator